MKTRLQTVKDGQITYDVLVFVCPGCASTPDDTVGLHMLPVNNDNVETTRPSWDWNGDFEHPTLSPSILSRGAKLCLSFLRDGYFEFLNDSEHPLAGKTISIPDLPDWLTEVSEDDEDEDE